MIVERRPVKKWNPTRHDDELRALHAEGLLDGEIGRRMGFTHNTVRTHRAQLGLPCHPSKHNPNGTPPQPAREPRRKVKEEKTDPLRRAGELVQGFDRNTMTLDRRPVTITAVMRLTNAQLKRLGKPQIGYNPEWLV